MIDSFSGWVPECGDSFLRRKCGATFPFNILIKDAKNQRSVRYLQILNKKLPNTAPQPLLSIFDFLRKGVVGGTPECGDSFLRRENLLSELMV